MTVALISMICMIAMMPGSSTTAILDITWTHGRRFGFLTALGGSAGVAIYTLLAFALGAMVSGEDLWISILEGVGALYLAALGITALIEAFAVSKDGHVDEEQVGISRFFTTGLFTTLLSPKLALFYLVILTQYEFSSLAAGAGILVTGALHTVVRLCWYGFWIHLVHPLQQRFDSVWVQRSMKLVTGALLIALSLHIVF